MDRIKKERKVVRSTITKITNEVDRELDKDEVSKAILQAKFTRLDQLHHDIQRLDREVLDGLLDSEADDETLEGEQIQVEEYLQKILVSQGSINSYLDKRSEEVSSQDDAASIQSSAMTTRKFKLPKIQLKTFNGDLKEWLGWWAQFRKIHEDESLDPTDKFQYLYQSTVAGSRAREVLDAYPQSAENYPKVIEKLKTRFGKEKLLKHYYIKELLKLVSPCGKSAEAVSNLYYALDSHTRALASLGVTTEQAADFLYPMVESCLPEELMIVWQRHPNYLKDGSQEDPVMTELSYMLDFLRVEVENQEQRKLTKLEGPSTQKHQRHRRPEKELGQEDVSTSAGLFEGKGKEKCIFCAKTNHQSHECFKALNMSLEEKRKKVNDSKGCYICFKGHMAKACKAPVRCSLCSKKHYHFMCPDLHALKQAHDKPPGNNGSREVKEVTQSSTETVAVNSGVQCGGDVLLKTVLVWVVGKSGNKLLARLLFDEGSQSSYVTSYVVRSVSSKPVGEERVKTVMIDGKVSPGTLFYKHELTVLDAAGSKVKLLLRERPVIGGIPPRAQLGKWSKELERNGITIEDHGGSAQHRQDIDILIGSDYREQLMTGKRIHLRDGVYAVQSLFGWMLCGPVFKAETSACETVIHSYLTGSVCQLWDLDLLGIRDPIQKSTELDSDQKLKETFQKQVTRETTGRYVVKLPWVNAEVKCHLPTNESVSVKRLDSATAKLERQGKFSTYDAVFKGWEEEGIIEIPVQVDPMSGHYLPHRPVFKESVTTPVRPVFDASCRMTKRPSLNQCLEKGPNWLELIPAMLIRFREKKIGVISDIRKAFQMISVAPEDRKYQKFYWWRANGDKKELQPYQHCRVVFGLTCSPFILAAILDLHLSQVKEQWKCTAELLKRSLYVDNCVTSFDQEEEYRKFKDEAIDILSEAKMDLRQWESQVDQTPIHQSVTTVLGLHWDKKNDTLYCQVPKDFESEVITKRVVLSLVSQVFEPIGYASPSLLQPKLMLQEAWATDLGWDDQWDNDRREAFLKWYSEISELENIRIPRHAVGLSSGPARIQLHVFTDASQLAYAGAVFVRVAHGDGLITVQLLASKARVAPLDKKKKNRVTIPRLELLGCLVGARLWEATATALDTKNVVSHFWTDSMTALSWIQKEGNWGTFVGNRVSEIVRLTGGSSWRHIPGILNPADLPSRGCPPKELRQSKWWEGPEWLYQEEYAWPKSEAVVDEQLVNAEKKKTTLVAIQTDSVEPRFSSYLKNVRVAAWVKRFLYNCKVKPETNRIKIAGIGKEELLAAEADILRDIQRRYFGQTPKLKNLDVFLGEDGLLRVKSRLTYKTDTDQFRSPILLPKEDSMVHLLVHHVHRSSGHGGVQFVLGKLREKYWLPQGRKTVGAVLQRCVVCKRHKGQSLQPEAAPLPKDRVETVFAFQTTGVDLAGPVILKGGSKAWIVLYTCAVYRGIHLDLVTSLSWEAFISSLERFVSVIGRPNRLYSDNGTNFVGTRNVMKLLDWKTLEREFEAKEIKWTFNPPAAPWWGGWWERMVRSTKELLRRMLGSAKLTQEELLTCLATVSGTINDRPLTTLTEDGGDLIPLTPRMFMRDLPIAVFPEGDEIGASQLRGAFKKLQELKAALRARFRKEYLAMLVQKGNEKPSVEPRVGDVVLIGYDDRKRFQWPLGKIVELGAGADGKVRVAKVRIACKPKVPGDYSCTILTRPLQRLYPLEMSIMEERFKTIRKEIVEEVKDKVKVTLEDDEPEPTAGETVTTRKGRLVKKPQRYGTWNF